MKILLSLMSILLFSNSFFFFFYNSKKISNSDLLKVYFLNGYGVIYQFDENEKFPFRFHLDISTRGFDLSSERESRSLGEHSSESTNERDLNETSLSIQISPQYYFKLISKIM